MRAPLLLGVAMALLPGAARAEPPRATAAWVDSAPRIDGKLDDPAWRRGRVFGNFVERGPRLGAKPPVRTTFRVLVDGEALYVGVHCHDDKPERIRGTVRNRDTFSIFRDDAISLKLDVAHDHRSTLGFAVNTVGARLDYRGINEVEWREEFDMLWHGMGVRVADGWSAEFRIPWASLGIDPADPPATIGFDLSRDHSRRAASYDWSLIPPPFAAIAASRYGHLSLQALRRADGATAERALNYTLVPYALGGFEQRRGDDGRLDTDAAYDLGLDARAQLGARLRAQLTINTDFAQVDLDAQQVNLTRFGLFFPEKRDFFLRDLEVFSFGRSEAQQLLYTRRIGLSRAQAVPILGGIKLVAQGTHGTRVGLLHVITRPEAGLPWTSNLVGRALVELGQGSNLGVMLTHRQSFATADDSNLVVGLDGAWREGPLLVDGFAMVSVTGPEAADPAPAVGAVGTGRAADRPQPAMALSALWRGRLFRPRLRYIYLDRDFRADLGFIKRVGVHDAAAELAVEPRIERWGLQKLTLTLRSGVVAGTDPAQLLDWSNRILAALSWEDGYWLQVWLEQLSELVLSPFSLGRSTLIAADRYAMERVTINASTPYTWPVSFEAGFTARDFYGGTLIGVSAEVSARIGALLRLELKGGVDQARFPDSADDFDSRILDGSIGLSFSRNLVWDNFLAWNDLENLLRFRSRLRWTYHLGSDLFVVYQHDLTDDWDRTDFQSLLVKATFSY